MISLSDPELAAVMEAARPIHPRDREHFLQDVASELARYPELGVGVIHRVVAKLQREHLNGPRDRGRVAKWSR
ncbi:MULTISPECIES: hypothetical protein [unclassified Bradyrhizobium]|uniref:hypothetical protein n=1 Tax=unclassified Bradyrhizobium TaxID=2631580 RepID=UPI0033951117